MPISKIQYASDLHLEFPQNKAYIKANPLLPCGELLILAGDIVPFAIMHRYNDFFNYLSDNFKTTYWLPGNHEYYHFDIADKSDSFLEKIKPNVVLLNNKTVEIEGIQLIFSTLWSKINPINQLYIENYHSDFHLIQYKGKTFTTEIYNQLHSESIEFLRKSIATQKHEKKIVITHHVPTLKNYPDIYKGSKLNDGFVVELYETIANSSVDYWLYGHSHCNTKNFSIQKTKMRTNQLGYVQQNEHIFFDEKALIKI